MDAVHRYGGYVSHSTGNGIFAIFGATLAHEDHPQRDDVLIRDKRKSI